MGRITDKLNPWGNDEKHVFVAVNVAGSEGEFYVHATPETEEESKLCFVVKDKPAIDMLIATLEQARISLEKFLEQDA